MARSGPHTFLNNVSLGIYGEAVRSPANRDAEMRTLLQTVAEVMGSSAEAPALRLVTAGTQRQHHRPDWATSAPGRMGRSARRRVDGPRVIDVRDELQVTG